jgi:hypothetical protein
MKVDLLDTMGSALGGEPLMFNPKLPQPEGWCSTDCGDSTCRYGPGHRPNARSGAAAWAASDSDTAGGFWMVGGDAVRDFSYSEQDAKLAQKLGQLQPLIAVLPHGCTGQLA